MSKPTPPTWVRPATVLLAIVVPVALLLTNVRLLLTPAYVQLAYRMPAFPEDRYGLTRAERIGQAQTALAYLLNDAGSEFLGDLEFDDGAPVYNEREVRHMVDVKRLVQAAMRVWIGSLAVAGTLGIALWRLRGVGTVAQGLNSGSRLTLWVMGILGVGLIVTFSTVFVGFHRVFFEGDTWLFLYTDTLIRLFPERFWQDAFIILAGSTLAEAVALLLVTRRTVR
jgi:integral membrane protein (TIGR01906 family)